MNEIELKKVLLDRFERSGLRPYLAERQQQCLEMEDGFFVEVVLKDASKLAEVENIIEEVRAEQAAQGVKLDSVVRALWEVKNIRHIGTPPAESGGIKAAERFYVELKSGGAEQLVEIDLSWGAIEELKGKIGRIDSESMGRLVENFVKMQLSAGGLSYWDPTKYHHQDVGPAAVLYLLHHSPMTAA